MEIEEEELDQEWLDTQAMLIKKRLLDLQATNCWPKALERNMAMSFIARITHIVVN